MKGSRNTDELMAAVVAHDTGIRTERRISHCFVMDVPTPQDLLIITDAAVNIAPTLVDKVDIVRNAIDLAHAIGLEDVRVAILSGMELVNPKVPRGRGTVQDGEPRPDHRRDVGRPLALDNAIDLEASAIKHIVSPVVGLANVLVVPDLVAGSILAKGLSFLAGSDSAGIVLGARVPIILTSRADSLPARPASCAIAVLVAAGLLATGARSAT